MADLFIHMCKHRTASVHEVYTALWLKEKEQRSTPCQRTSAPANIEQLHAGEHDAQVVAFLLDSNELRAHEEPAPPGEPGWRGTNVLMKPP